MRIRKIEKSNNRKVEQTKNEKFRIPETDISKSREIEKLENRKSRNQKIEN